MAKELWQQYNNLLNDFIDLIHHEGLRQNHEPLTFTPPTPEEKRMQAHPSPLLPQDVAFFTNDSQTLFEETLTNEPLLNQGTGVPWCGKGELNPVVMVITLAPMRDDMWLTPEADEYLTKWLQAIHIERGNCYHTSFFRLATKDATVRNNAFKKLCYELIIRQIRLVQPEILLLCGAETAGLVLQKQLSMASMSTMHLVVENYPTVVTHDPVAVLKNQSYRRAVWQDLTRLAKLIEE